MPTWPKGFECGLSKMVIGMTLSLQLKLDFRTESIAQKTEKIKKTFLLTSKLWSFATGSLFSIKMKKCSNFERPNFYLRVGLKTEKCQGVYLPSDDKRRLTHRLYDAYSSSRLKGSWIWLPDLLLASMWIYLVDPFLALPCIYYH